MSQGRSFGPFVTYLLAMAGTAAAVLLRWLVDPVLGDSLPLVTLYGAVAGAVWLGGYRPAIVAGVAGYAVCVYLFMPPRGAMRLGDSEHLVGLAAYLFTCVVIIVFGEAARRANARANERSQTLQVTLRSIGDAVVTTDLDGRVTDLNTVAESLTGWTRGEAIGQPLDSVFRIVHEGTRQPADSPAARALRAGIVVGLANHTVLIRKDGAECPIDDSAAPIKDEEGRVTGCVLTFRDVSDQRRLEQDKTKQLMAARLLASIVESSDDGIVSKSLDGVIQSWNAGAERIFGHRAEEAVGRHISLVIPTERLGEENEIVASLRAGRRIEHFETERLAKDGRRILVSLTISPLRDDAGTVVGASKIVRDVTRQRQTEQRERMLFAEAAAANAKFQAFFDQGPLFAGILRVDGTILEPNRMSCEGCGYSREQVIGKPFWEGPWWSPSPDLKAQVQAAYAMAASGRVFHAELPYFVADGSERVADVTIQPIKDDRGGILFLAPIWNDITDRKRAEADRETFVRVLENSTDFIGMCDLQGVPFFVNRAGLQMVGLEDLEQARRTPVADFFFPEDQPGIVNEFFPSVLERGHGEVEVRFRHFKTGQALWMSYKVLTLPDENGRPVALATVSQNVTGRKQMEDNLRRLAADLSEADRRKNEFLAMLAHELRNPLAPIRNAVQSLRLGTRGAETVHTAAEMLERQVAQMVRLVDDLLDMSRITRGKIELRRETTELAPIVHQAVESARILCKALDHELTVRVPPHPIYLDTDPARLTQVLGNLLNNACKFTDRGGHVRLTAEEDGGQVVIRVKDDGIGIAPEQLPRLFEMFTQVDTSLERSRDGLGIGLTLVKTLVEMQGGTVEAHSEGLGRGSEFVIRLPILAAAPPPEPPAALADSGSAARRRILIVDDNVDGAESLAMLLELGGHETHMSHDGLEAIEAAERLRPDAILLDIGLPRLNGFEIAQRIRSQSWGRDVVLIALTGWGQEEDRRRSMEAGFNSHMVKPVDHEVLLRLIASVPSRSEAGVPHPDA
jgi:PAS domain S-box-containing protein